MAIILKNPMPMSGALFVTNPRKRKKSSKKKSNLSSLVKKMQKSKKSSRKPKRRKNAGQPRTAAKYIAQANNITSAAQIDRMSDAQFSAAAKKGMAAKKAVSAKRKSMGPINYLKSRPAGKTMYKTTAAIEDAILKRLGKSQGKAPSSGREKGVKPAGTSRYTALVGRRKAKPAQKARGLFAGDRSVTSKKKTKSKAQSAEGKFDIALYNKLVKQGFGKAKAKTMARQGQDMLYGMDLASNPWYGAKGPQGGHAGAAYIRWGKTKKGKELLARYHKSRGKTAGKAKKDKSKGDYGKIFSQVSKEFKKKNFKTAASRMKAIHKEARKRMNQKSTSSTRTQAQRQRTQKKAKKLNEYQSVMKSFGGLGLARKQLLKIYEELSTLEQKQVKKELKSLKKKSGEKDEAFKKRVRAAANKLIKEPSRSLSGRKVALNPKHKRKNPGRRKNALSVKKNKLHRRKNSLKRRKNQDKKPVGKVREVLDGIGKKISKMPVVGKVAGVVFVAGVTGSGIVALHKVAEPVVMPIADKILSPIPVVGDLVLKNPYLTMGTLVTSVSLLAAGKGLMTAKNAAWLSSSAVIVGVALDSALKMFSKAAAEVIVEDEAADAIVEGTTTDMGGYGDGGAYFIGAASQAQGPRSYGAIGMNLSGIDREYSDAVMVDAFACSDIMHPDEVAAILAGESYFFDKFGHSPGRTRKCPSDYSRHAGRPGHRFGWLIKLIGFANLQKIAALPAGQRESVIRQLREQACAQAPALIEAAKQEAQGAVETASLYMDGGFNGAQSFNDANFGSLIFAGSDY